MSDSLFMGALLSTMLNVNFQVNRSIGKMIWVLMDSNAGSTICGIITRTVSVPRLQICLLSLSSFMSVLSHL